MKNANHSHSNSKPQEIDRVLVGNKYQIFRLIGQGSSSEVYLGKNVQTNIHVAIKKFKKCSTNSCASRNQHHQAGLLKQITHLNIIKLIDEIIQIDCLNKNNYNHYLVFDYFPLNLRQVLKTYNYLQEYKVVHIFRQILEALKCLNSKNIIHRDLKPENILLSQNLQHVVICDFGLSVQISHNTQNNKGKYTHHVMTRWYRAPQIILLFYTYDTQIDIWSLGCIFAQLIQLTFKSKFYQKKILFPGKSCYPSSPPSKHANIKYETKNGFPHSSFDQLSSIISILGNPQDLSFIDSKKCIEYLNSFDKKQKIKFHQILNQIPLWAQNILQQMLQYDPNVRISANDALKCPIFNIKKIQHQKVNLNIFYNTKQSIQTCINFDNIVVIKDQQLQGKQRQYLIETIY